MRKRRGEIGIAVKFKISLLHLSRKKEGERHFFLEEVGLDRAKKRLTDGERTSYGDIKIEGK